MSVCLLLIDDGREDYLARCRRSLARRLPVFPYVVEVLDPEHHLGFAGAVQEGWSRVLETDAEWVWHAESDFTYNAPIPLQRMIAVLKGNPHLTQIALLRQPWSAPEQAAGGYVRQHPDDFHEAREQGEVWTQTRRFGFTTNPSVYSVDLCRRGFPDPPESEGRFGLQLLRDDPERACGIWGGKFDPPRVHHIGAHRTGTGY